MPDLHNEIIRQLFNKLVIGWSKKTPHEISRVMKSHERICEISQREDAPAGNTVRGAQGD